MEKIITFTNKAVFGRTVGFCHWRLRVRICVGADIGQLAAKMGDEVQVDCGVAFGFVVRGGCGVFLPAAQYGRRHLKWGKPAGCRG